MVQGKVRINEKSLIIFIVAAGALLRLWHFTEIPFTHDEFSALIRTRYDTFTELIEKGVMVDGHPAGVQILIWLLVRMFGDWAPAIKAPFVVFSLLSVWLTYAIGKRWFNATAGLVTAAFLSFLQFPVMYGQIARPYSAGLFFTLLMVWFWTNIIFNPEKKYPRNAAGFIIAAALSGYTHHFAALFAIITGVTGIILIEGKYRIKYLTACSLALLLYLPHLPILVAQLKTGGVEGWLHKPRFDFLVDFTRYVFHFSTYILFIIIILGFLAYQWHDPEKKINRKMLLVSAVWFITVYLTGFIYSIFRSAVLQYSVLLFVLPYLLFLIAGLLTTTRPKHQAILVLILMLIIPSLILERRHYSLFYQNPYREMVAESKIAVAQFGNRETTIILDTKKEINTFYTQQPAYKQLDFKYLDDIGTKEKLFSYLNNTTVKYLAFGCLSSTAWENYSVIREVFPYLIKHKCYAGGDFYIFSKAPQEKAVDEYYLEYKNTFEPSPGEWINYNPVQCKDSLPLAGTSSYYCDSSSEFSPTFQKGLRDLCKNPDDVIDISVDVRLPLVFPGAWLIATITSKGRNIYRASAPVTSFAAPGSTGRVFLSLRLSDIELRHHELLLTTYIWNPHRHPYVMDNYILRVRKGNPVIYGLIRPVKGRF